MRPAAVRSFDVIRRLFTRGLVCALIVVLLNRYSIGKPIGCPPSGWQDEKQARNVQQLRYAIIVPVMDQSPLGYRELNLSNNLVHRPSAVAGASREFEMAGLQLIRVRRSTILSSNNMPFRFLASPLLLWRAEVETQDIPMTNTAPPQR
jgi:hypothetical protein